MSTHRRGKLLGLHHHWIRLVQKRIAFSIRRDICCKGTWALIWIIPGRLRLLWTDRRERGCERILFLCSVDQAGAQFHARAWWTCRGILGSLKIASIQFFMLLDTNYHNPKQDFLLFDFDVYPIHFVERFSLCSIQSRF